MNVQKPAQCKTASVQRTHRTLFSLWLTLSLSFFLLIMLNTIAHASGCMPSAQSRCPDNRCPRNCSQDVCCGRMGGIHYCDSSAGRFVCKNGEYSSCYCTRHAVMDFQRLHGCCFWQGGVLTVDLNTRAVICNNGSVSEICTLQNILGGENM